ncbi:DUF411 domain-containing protein [Dichotomicrobium thermohalophilum]|uniref:CopG family transcriptional regulator n=1 Tax=Dichotomicrobium thermohalophilum TaxID=933063 RepID=A0A397PFK0_9HYPH|nr:DUF411 domain-containing protein [Dichotomicrobium thermohalophilum]RIA47233.1 hypothetical protein BXY53_2615 [Dichotomicrobium thermohalophilum]
MTFLTAVMVLLATTLMPLTPVQASDQSTRAQSLPIVEMTKHPQCGCCTEWADHLRAAGFEVKVTETRKMWGVKRLAGIPKDLDSCHTATVGGYVIEGHVPADDIKRLLAEHPDVKGLAVPGMPIGSPGMEFGNRTEPYDVLSFDADGQTDVFQSYR